MPAPVPDPSSAAVASGSPAREDLGAALDAARDDAWEDPARARATAMRVGEVARTLGAHALRARALALQGAVALHGGDLRGAYTLAAEADEHADRAGDDAAWLEVAALRAQLSFFSGSYTEALACAARAIELADGTGDDVLRVHARRAACLVLGNLDAPGWREELDELLRLSVSTGNRWQEAVSRNDLGHHLMVTGDLGGAERELGLGLAIAAELAPANAIALAALHCTRAELRLGTGRPAEALDDADRALGLLTRADEPNPYLFGMTVRLEVQALLALGRPDDAQRSGVRALDRLGERVPQARSMILDAVSTALREAGRLEEAYEALAAGAALERTALQELTELRLGFERAALEAKAARQHADAMAQKNRELEVVLDELARANSELEGLHTDLREQADRDALTGLHNRRFLDARLARLAAERHVGPFSVAVLDLDRFKAVNDDFGHAAGDQVLVRTAALLRAVVRTSDVVVRSGGEEFVLLMPDTGAEAAVAVCERLLAALRGESWRRIDDALRVTASVGVATATGDEGRPVDAEELAAVADARLYQAKRAGRDRVVAAAS